MRVASLVGALCLLGCGTTAEPASSGPETNGGASSGGSASGGTQASGGALASGGTRASGGTAAAGSSNASSGGSTNAAAGSGGASSGGRTGQGGTPSSTVNDCNNLPAPGIWEEITPALQRSDSQPDALGLDPQHVGTLYTQVKSGGNGHHDAGDGLRKSTDCGATWSVVPGGRNATDASTSNIHAGALVAIIVDPFDSNMIYTASNYGPGGVWRSLDGGTNWDQLVPASVGQYVNALWFNGLTMDPANHEHLIAVTHAGCTGPYSPNCMAETRDAGATWTLTTLPAPWAEGNGMYIFGEQTFIWETGQNGAFLTKDGGQHWNKVFSGGNGAGSGNEPFLSQDGYYYVPTDYGLTRSKKDDLTGWENVYSGQFWALVGTGKNMYASARNTLGIWKATTDAPAAWTQMQIPAELEQAGGIGSQPKSPSQAAPFMAYDEAHHLLYVNNWWVVLRVVVP